MANSREVVLQAFSKESPRAWFLHSESLMALGAVTESQAKYHHLVRVLPLDVVDGVVDDVEDAATLGDDDPYAKLKEAVLRHLGATRRIRVVASVAAPVVPKVADAGTCLPDDENSEQLPGGQGGCPQPPVSQVLQPREGQGGGLPPQVTKVQQLLGQGGASQEQQQHPPGQVRGLLAPDPQVQQLPGQGGGRGQAAPQEVQQWLDPPLAVLLQVQQQQQLLPGQKVHPLQQDHKVHQTPPGQEVDPLQLDLPGQQTPLAQEVDPLQLDPLGQQPGEECGSPPFKIERGDPVGAEKTQQPQPIKPENAHSEQIQPQDDDQGRHVHTDQRVVPIQPPRNDQSRHLNTEKRVPIQPPRNDQSRHACPACVKSFALPRDLTKHAKNVHNITAKKPTCDVCGRSFSRGVDLSVHVRSVHERRKPFACEICETSFARNSSLLSHVRSVHGESSRPHACEQCRWSFTRRSHLRSHVAGVHGGRSRNLACAVCEATFARGTDLAGHLSRAHDKAVNCVTCDMSCTCGSNNATQVQSPRKHDNQCRICEKPFLHERHLVHHFGLAHAGLRPFACDLCQASPFANRWSLLRHVDVVHAGVKNFACEDCHKSFGQKVRLTRHAAAVHNKPSSRGGGKAAAAT
jgi:hypothetical protein